MRAVTEARRSGGVRTVIITWLGTRTPPTPRRAKQMAGMAVATLWGSMAAREAEAREC